MGSSRAEAFVEGPVGPEVVLVLVAPAGRGERGSRRLGAAWAAEAAWEGGAAWAAEAGWDTEAGWDAEARWEGGAA